MSGAASGDAPPPLRCPVAHLWLVPLGRSPEVLLGQKYSTPCDMWSCACVIFELVTGDLLFDPRDDPRNEYSREEDHLALMIELLGHIPRRMWQSGRFSRDYFTSKGELRHIKRLKFWPLEDVLTDKYKLPREEAVALAEFLLPMLDFVPETRATAADMLRHPWLQGVSMTGQVLPSASYQPRGGGQSIEVQGRVEAQPAPAPAAERMSIDVEGTPAPPPPAPAPEGHQGIPLQPGVEHHRSESPSPGPRASHGDKND